MVPLSPRSPLPSPKSAATYQVVYLIEDIYDARFIIPSRSLLRADQEQPHLVIHGDKLQMDNKIKTSRFFVLLKNLANKFRTRCLHIEKPDVTSCVLWWEATTDTSIRSHAEEGSKIGGNHFEKLFKYDRWNNLLTRSAQRFKRGSLSTTFE